jgi:hypothetical protein
LSKNPHLAGLKNIQVVEIRMGGWPSAVMWAKISLEFKDGSFLESDLNYEPEGLIYESFMWEINQLVKYLSKDND